MRQLTFVKPGAFEWRDVPAPTLAADTDAIVKPIAVARCDLDLYIAAGITVYPGGAFAFGHECVGEVVEAGPKAGVKPGERVIVPFQLSCGRCANCKRGYTNTCEAYPFRAAYGLKPLCGTEFGGALSDRMYVPFADHMLIRLPPNLDPVAVASAADNVPDGWRAVAPHLKPRPGANVLVVGGLAQSVALYAAGAAKSLGAARVLYLDDDPIRRTHAKRFGIDVEPLALNDRRDKAKANRGLAASGATFEQFDITVDGTGNADALDFIIASTAPNGVCTSVAIYLTPTTPMPLTKMYSKGITFITGRVHARAELPAMIDCCATGHFHPEHVTSRVVPFSQSAEAMTDSGPKLVFTNDWPA
ncbi:MAG: alcohol dehydrogenase catalytic domain-containing protein [Alphaproteobacteria bacterium]|nr:alcohol dehydrogenase catalytic domain-containing protein [Alphaproteobacteria bacterium]